MRRLVLLGLLVSTACSSGTAPAKAPALLTSLPRELSANESRVAGAANQFTFQLFKRLNAAQRDSNVFVSPLSVSFSLGMAMNGANGTTLDEMRTTLGFNTAQLAEINDGYRSLMALEAGLDATTTFEIANSMWYRDGFPVQESFKQTLASAFDAEVRASPFDATTVGAVNGWVSDKTHGKIPTILDAIDASDVMFLINAIYFKGTWRRQFDPDKTQDATFQAPEGSQPVRMMTQPHDTTIRFSSDGTLTAGELTYGNGAFAMTVLVPATATTVDALAESLDLNAWNGIIAGLQDAKVDVRLPKFQLEYERSLKEDLEALGMRVPFIPDGADFTAMSPMGRQLFIAFVKHKTFVDVNEEGTEAAAVTNTGIEVTSAPPCLCADHPFIFAIRERFSGTILFIGKIVRVP